jgi:hypothetical protein
MAIHRVKAFVSCLGIERVIMIIYPNWAKLQAPGLKLHGAKSQPRGPSGGSRVARRPSRAYQTASPERRLKRWPGPAAITFSSRGRFGGDLPKLGTSAPSTKNAMFWLLNTWYQASTRGMD